MKTLNLLRKPMLILREHFPITYKKEQNDSSLYRNTA